MFNGEPHAEQIGGESGTVFTEKWGLCIQNMYFSDIEYYTRITFYQKIIIIIIYQKHLNINMSNKNNN